MPLYGKLSLSGELTDIGNTVAGQIFTDGSTAVPVIAQPAFFGPYGYDSANQIAVPSAAILTAQQQSQAITLYQDVVAQARAMRAIVLLAVNQLNVLRDRLTAQDAAVAAATSLADLKSRWATLASAAPLPDLTPQQAANAIQANINGNA